VVNGANYGWPFANPNPDGGLDFPPVDPDYDNNRDWSLYPPSTFTRISKALQAHSAPLGYIFTHLTALPDSLAPGALLAYHGSWNRTRKTATKSPISHGTAPPRPSPERLDREIKSI
jgi:glucose/arabinose dehydrogenase